MRTKIITRTVLYIDHPEGTRLYKGAVRKRVIALLDEDNKRNQPSDFVIAKADVQKVDLE